MERLVRILALVLALLLIGGAAVVFVRAQILKSAPSPIVGPAIGNRVFSPDAYKPRRREATLRVELRERQQAVVLVLDADDRPVARARMQQTGRRIRASWDGTNAAGDRAADGIYRFAIELEAGERLIRIPDPIRLDATPPEVQSTAKAGRYITPGLEGDIGVYSFTLSSSEPTRFRLDVRQVQPNGTARLIRRETHLAWERRKQMRWAADAGNLPLDRAGEPVGPGSYIVGGRAEDRAGNLVIAPAIVEPGELEPARVVGVRTVALTPSLQPVTLLSDVELVRYRPAASFPGTAVARAQGAPGAVRLPPAQPGFYAIEIAGGGWQGWAPEAVPGRAPVLVMSPLYSWQAANTADADLSGFPDVPPAPLALDRPLGEGAEAGLAEIGRVAAVLAAGTDRRVGAITDARIEARGVPRGTRLVAIAGAPVWTPGLIAALARYQRRGGLVLVLDDTSLQRRAERTGDAITLEPGTASAIERLAPLRTIRAADAALTRPAD
jgi:hypothetical protein